MGRKSWNCDRPTEKSKRHESERYATCTRHIAKQSAGIPYSKIFYYYIAKIKCQNEIAKKIEENFCRKCIFNISSTLNACKQGNVRCIPAENGTPFFCRGISYIHWRKLVKQSLMLKTDIFFCFLQEINYLCSEGLRVLLSIAE